MSKQLSVVINNPTIIQCDNSVIGNITERTIEEEDPPPLAFIDLKAAFDMIQRGFVEMRDRTESEQQTNESDTKPA